jgi:hypothetical protein
MERISVCCTVIAGNKKSILPPSRGNGKRPHFIREDFNTRTAVKLNRRELMEYEELPSWAMLNCKLRMAF